MDATAAEPIRPARRPGPPWAAAVRGVAAAALRPPYRKWTLGVVTGLVVAGGACGGLAYYLLADPVRRMATLHPEQFPTSTPDQRTPDRLRVLFVGNSFTQFNGGIALSLRALAASAGKAPPPVFDQVTKFGATWAQLWAETPAPATIRQGGWDYVVLQDYSRAATIYRSEMDHYGRQFAGAVRDAGAKPIFFMTWARKDEPQTQSAISGAYSSVAMANHAALAPVGAAWAASLKGRPGLVLHRSDKKHPTAAGTYLTACVFYAVLYHQSPHGLTPTVADGTTVYVHLTPSDAAYLQDVAWRTVQNAGRSAATRPATRPATAPNDPPVARPASSS